MLHLGYGFCFIGRQYRLEVGDEDFCIDLLFYHRFLKSLVAIELKTGRFTPEDAGKMDLYLNVLNERVRAPDDNPSMASRHTRSRSSCRKSWRGNCRRRRS